MKRFAKYWNGYDAIFAFLFAVVITLASLITFSGNVYGNNTVNYISDFQWYTPLLFVASLIVVYVLLHISFPWINKIYLYIVGYKPNNSLRNINKSIEHKNIKSKMIFWILMLIIFWAPYLLTYYPGSIFVDTFASLDYIYQGFFTNRHPAFITFIIQVAIWFSNFLGQDNNFAMACLMIFQTLFIQGVFIWIIWLMLRQNINNTLRVIISWIMVLFPFFPLYAILIGKDTIFSGFFLIWFCCSVHMFRIFKNKSNFQINSWYGGWAISGLLMSLSRTNGFFILAGLSLIFFIVALLNKKINKWCLLYILVPTFFAYLIIYPIFDFFGADRGESAIETSALMIQQVSYTFVNGGNITDSQLSQLDYFIGLDNISNNFCPCIDDLIKFDKNWSSVKINITSDNFLDFFVLWFNIGTQNVGMYFKEFLLNSLGFWNPFAVDYNGFYIQAGTSLVSRKYGVSSFNIMNDIFGMDLTSVLVPAIRISSSVWIWSYALAIWYIGKRFGFKESLVYSPQVFVWLTLMIATPIAFSLRYIVCNMFTFMFLFLIPYSLHSEELKLGLGTTKD